MSQYISSQIPSITNLDKATKAKLNSESSADASRRKLESIVNRGIVPNLAAEIYSYVYRIPEYEYVLDIFYNLDLRVEHACPLEPDELYFLPYLKVAISMDKYIEKYVYDDNFSASATPIDSLYELLDATVYDGVSDIYRVAHEFSSHHLFVILVRTYRAIKNNWHGGSHED